MNTTAQISNFFLADTNRIERFAKNLDKPNNDKSKFDKENSLDSDEDKFDNLLTVFNSRRILKKKRGFILSWLRSLNHKEPFSPPRSFLNGPKLKKQQPQNISQLDEVISKVTELKRCKRSSVRTDDEVSRVLMHKPTSDTYVELVCSAKNKNANVLRPKSPIKYEGIYRRLESICSSSLSISSSLLSDF